MIGNPYKGRAFKGLLKYLHEGRKGEENPDRVIWSEARNLSTTDPMVVAGVMVATAKQSRRVKKPVYHLPISWPPEEQPPKEVQMQVAETLLDDLGLSEHQQLIVAHDDGRCPHIHIVVNTVHPETGRAWNPWQDVPRIMESLERQERELGFQIVDRPDLEEWRTGEKDPDRKKNATREEKLRAEREGDTPLAKWSENQMRGVRGRITAHFRDATSWLDLETRLGEHGLELRRAGQGFRITDGKHYMTLSKVGKHARQERLEDRFEEAWDDYEIERDLNRDLAAQLEPKDFDYAQTAEERREQATELREARAKAKSEANLKNALLAANRYAYFKGQENRAKEAAQQHIKNARAIRRVQWIKERLGEDIGKANGEFDAVCSKLYRNPKAAWAEIERRIEAGQDVDEIDLDTVGKKRGWKFFGYRSQGRKHANEVAKSLPRAHRKLERLRNRWEVNEHSELELHARLGASEDEYNEAVAALGSREERRKRGMALWRERQNVVGEIDERDIWQSELREEEKEQLARAWEETLEAKRRIEAKGLRNDTMLDYYEMLYQRTQQDDNELER